MPVQSRRNSGCSQTRHASRSKRLIPAVAPCSRPKAWPTAPTPSRAPIDLRVPNARRIASNAPRQNSAAQEGRTSRDPLPPMSGDANAAPPVWRKPPESMPASESKGCSQAKPRRPGQPSTSQLPPAAWPGPNATRHKAVEQDQDSPQKPPTKGKRRAASCTTQWAIAPHHALWKELFWASLK